MRNSNKPKEMLIDLPHAIAYRQGSSYYAEAKRGGRSREKNAEWAIHTAHVINDQRAARQLIEDGVIG